MAEVDVYIVRIYRHDSIAGTIESVETGEQLPFRAAAQLWDALQRLASLPGRNHGNQPDGRGTT